MKDRDDAQRLIDEVLRLTEPGSELSQALHTTSTRLRSLAQSANKNWSPWARRKDGSRLEQRINLDNENDVQTRPWTY